MKSMLKLSDSSTPPLPELPKWLANPDPTIYRTGSFLVLDFEVIVNDGRFGSAIDPRNILALACYRKCTRDPQAPDGVKAGRTTCTWASEYAQQGLIDAIRSVDFIVAHNAKYELGWLRRCGLDLHDVLVFDTKLAEYVLLGNLAVGDPDTGVAARSTSLDMCGRRRGYRPKDPIVALYLQHGVKIDEIPRRWVEDRCKQDVDTTYHVFLSQLAELERTNRLAVAFTRCIFTPVLADMEFVGAHVSADRVAAYHNECDTKFKELESEFDKFTGGINWRSPKQVGSYLYDTLRFEENTGRRGAPKRTATGRRATSVKAIDKLVATTDEQRRFVELRKAVGKYGTALSKSLNYLKGVVDDPTSNGLFHFEFNQTRTATHRISSTGIPSPHGSIQGQNFPRAFKAVFSPRRAGWLIADIDGAQLEFRVAADLCNDAQAKADILDKDFDIHVTSAAVMAGRTYRDLYDAYKGGDKRAALLRQDAKPESFKPLYGGKKGTPKQEKWYREFRRRYAGVDKAQNRWIAEVLKTKRLVTPWGMRYYWPRASVSSTGYVNVGNAVSNYPVQAFATAEIIPVAVCYFWHRTRHLNDGQERLLIFNTVHDNIGVEFEPEVQDDMVEMAKRAFTTDVYGYLRSVYHYDFTVPLGVGIKIGSNLGEGKELAFNIFPDGHEERVK